VSTGKMMFIWSTVAPSASGHETTMVSEAIDATVVDGLTWTGVGEVTSE
jgi:hypothetical protein